LRILLISTYELGHQPLGLARPAAHLQAAGHDVACLDLAVEPLDEPKIRRADLIALSIPMHTATRLATRAAAHIRDLNPAAHLTYYGLYAALNADVLLTHHADTVLGAEADTELVELANCLADGAWERGSGTSSRSHAPTLPRSPSLLPRRDLLPPLDRYARFDDGQRQKLAGYVEASRGCAHRCLHCPLTPVYRGRLRVDAQDVVLEDIRQLVALGAEHITFGDPDFFNGIKHSLRIVEALHAEFPRLSYDATIKVEHLLEHRAHLSTLARTGCAFVVSAVEAVDDAVLAHLAKGHTAADVEIALGLTAAAGLVLRPTFVAFTPWTTLNGYLRLLDFVERHQLIRHVDPVQFSIRLLIPRSSSLLGTPAMTPHLGPFDPATFTHRWDHPDPRVDDLQRRVAALVEQSARAGHDAIETFHRIKSLAHTALGRTAPNRLSVTPAASPIPHLTEPWFC
jgi:radical SAM superfamily enzyme YgiQ (UPF0313 family)